LAGFFKGPRSDAGPCRSYCAAEKGTDGLPIQIVEYFSGVCCHFVAILRGYWPSVDAMRAEPADFHHTAVRAIEEARFADN
jgi:hypothetical protein